MPAMAGRSSTSTHPKHTKEAASSKKAAAPILSFSRDRSAGPRVNDVWQRSIKSGMAIGLYSGGEGGEGEHALGVPLDHGGGGESVVSDASRPSEPPRAHDLGPGAGGVLAIAAGAVRVFCRRVVPITATATDRTNSLASPRRRSRGFRHFFLLYQQYHNLVLTRNGTLYAWGVGVFAGSGARDGCIPALGQRGAIDEVLKPTRVIFPKASSQYRSRQEATTPSC